MSDTNPGLPGSVEQTLAMLGDQHYVADRGLAVTLLLALKLGRPVFLEGEAGVGKTEVAKVLAAALGRRLIRMQCYEGIDVSTAVYEWNYTAQMLAIRMLETAADGDVESIKNHIYSEDYLIRRPLLEALSDDGSGAPVLLIDELDRADEPFEAYLLELLADFQVTIPELGPIKAAQAPIVVITSNRTREIHDAVKRRCFYYWVDYPDAKREYQIVSLKAPQADDSLSRQVVGFIQAVRGQDVFKKPGVAETIDWAHALTELDVKQLDTAAVKDTLGVVLKYQDDIQQFDDEQIEQTLKQVLAP